MRFPSFSLRGMSQKKEAKRRERELAMRGWGDSTIDEPSQGGLTQRHISHGIGHHFARNAFRGRGQA
jgi:hypothetical protein